MLVRTFEFGNICVLCFNFGCNESDYSPVFGHSSKFNTAPCSTAYFIQVLKDVHQVLRSIKPAVKDLEPSSPPIQHQKIAKTHGGNIAASAVSENRFAKLEIEVSQGPSEGEIASLVDPIKRGPYKKRHPNAREVKNTTDKTPESGGSFAIWCFFKDLNNLLAFVAQTWSEYCTGKLDLTAAAVSVNTAVALARSMEESFHTQFPDHFKVMMRVFLESAASTSKSDLGGNNHTQGLTHGNAEESFLHIHSVLTTCFKDFDEDKLAVVSEDNAPASQYHLDRAALFGFLSAL
ncbi:hypothetical protein E6O75_ATG02408 [Venturia nashicola]|uniref:DUF6604 domain-containing protein n=1 Tax=Venturia nashicola TaxID=86259 RepID=A0A4Z1P4Z1_9PEZI|nr:hypothetical protein E6O75_ATG02408 [Venturia nashicola]